MIRRSFLASGFTFAVVPLFAAAKPKTVLFVCEFGTAKSAIARELFRRRARERGIAVTAFSRGLKAIEDHVSLPLKRSLEAEGIDSRRDGFAVLSPDDLKRADVVVAFVPLPPNLHSRDLKDWTTVSSVNDAWPVARADLDRRIDALLDDLSTSRARR